MKKKCPFTRKPCMEDECQLYRRGIRFFDNPKEEPKPFAACTFVVLADAADNQIMRTLGLQEEMNVLRNTMERTVAGLIGMKKLHDAIDHLADHKATQKLLDQKKEVEEVIVVEEAEPGSGDSEISQD